MVISVYRCPGPTHFGLKYLYPSMCRSILLLLELKLVLKLPDQFFSNFTKSCLKPYFQPEYMKYNHGNILKQPPF